MSASPRIGIVLSSGGGRGVYAHTGFLLALERMDIPVAASAGCSAGAVVGGVVASGTGLDDWARVLASVDRREFWTPDSLPRFLWQMTVRRGRGYTGLSDTSAAIAFCRRNLAVQTFEKCQYPFHVVAVCLGAGSKAIFSSGELAPRMAASAAMPVLYRPVEIDGKYYCDGGLVELSPVDAICCIHKLDALIIHHSSQRPEEQGGMTQLMRRQWTMLEILNQLLYRQRPWYLSDERLTFHLCPGGCGTPVIVIEPELPPLKWPLTEGGARVRAAAMEQTESLLRPHLEALLSDPRKRLSPLATKDRGAARAGATCRDTAHGPECHDDKDAPGQKA